MSFVVGCLSHHPGRFNLCRPHPYCPSTPSSSLIASPPHTILTTSDTFIDTLPTHATHVFRFIPVNQ